MGYEKTIPGTFASADIILGVLSVTYTQTVNTPLAFVVFDAGITTESMTFDPVKVDNNSCTVNIGIELPIGTYAYRLLYTND
jgi:hypothetical protein